MKPPGPLVVAILFAAVVSLDDPSSRVGLKIELLSLPGGTNYPATTTLSIPGRQIEVRIANSGYQKVAN